MKKHILVIDDEAFITQLLASPLALNCYKVSIALSGQDRNEHPCKTCASTTAPMSRPEQRESFPESLLQYPLNNCYSRLDNFPASHRPQHAVHKFDAGKHCCLS